MNKVDMHVVFLKITQKNNWLNLRTKGQTETKIETEGCFNKHYSCNSVWERPQDNIELLRNTK